MRRALLGALAALMVIVSIGAVPSTWRDVVAGAFTGTLTGDLTLTGGGTVKSTTGGDITVDPHTFGNTHTRLEDDTSYALFGGATLGSATAFTSNGTTTLTKVAHGLTLAAGDACHITDATTAADEGMYQVESTTVDTITLDRALAGSDADVDAKFYADVIVFLDSDGTQGNWIRGFANDAPLQIGGGTRVTAGTAVDGEDVVFGSDVEFTETAYFKSTITTQSLWNFGTTSFSLMYAHPGLDDGVRLGLSPTNGRANNNLIITTLGNYAKDHDHDTPSASPTLWLHSSLNPDTNNTRWGSLHHTGTSGGVGDFTIATGAGGIDMAPAAQYLLPPRILSDAPAEPVACASPYDGAMVYVDDTNDTSYGQVCICANLDGTGYDWRLAADITGTACPFF